ncbi:MAG: hypothetical protein ABMB14_12685 [Myxococcota bacterium]
MTSSGEGEPSSPHPPQGGNWAEDLSGVGFAIYGEFSAWPLHLGADPADAVTRRGGLVSTVGDKRVAYVVLGRGRGKGRADAERKARSRVADGTVKLLDEAAFLHLLRVNLAGARFFVAGGFERADPGVPDSQPEVIVERVGGVVVPTLDPTVDYAVIGPKRIAGRAAAERTARELVDAGSALIVLDETAFFDLVRGQILPTEAGGFSTLLIELQSVLDPKRIRRALDMLQKEKVALYADASDVRVTGIVRSQTSDGVYSSALYADGRYACCMPTIEVCPGLQGKVCKHLIVLTLGLVHGGNLAPDVALTWLRKAARRRPSSDEDTLATTLVKYKAAEAGEIDWRPTETLPEDFYGF